MIDVHIHCVPPNLPGVGPLNPGLRDTQDNVAGWLRSEMESAGITRALAMGCLSERDDDPLGVGRTLEIAERVPGLAAIGVANPKRNDPEHLKRVERLIAAGQVVALKAYLGYVHCFPHDPGYRPYYELAERYRIPVFFHTGDTYSPYAKLKFAQPLEVDEVAVDHPNVKFVMCHVGNPWLLEAAEVVYKNFNVWIDLSGLAVGGPEKWEDAEERQTHEEAQARVAVAIRYAERPNRVLYGSDWPLAPMRHYRDFIGGIVPEACHAMVFEENARQLLRLEE